MASHPAPDYAVPTFSDADDASVSFNPFELAPLADIPCALAPAALDALAAFGRGAGTPFELSGFRPVASSRRAGEGYAQGQPVIGLETARLVAELRICGLPGLLVAEVTTLEEQTIAEVLEGGPPDVYFVAFASAADAERVARAPRPGYRLPCPSGR